MDETREVEYFLDKCDELMNSSFILAKSKLSEMLKAITASETLTKLFTSVVSGFDYIKAKKECFVSTTDGRTLKKMLVLPQFPTDKLAFIFCLLVDFDGEKIKFNDFLVTYFNCYDDYVKSFNNFCNQVIFPLRTLVKEAFIPSDDEKETYEAIVSANEESVEKVDSSAEDSPSFFEEPQKSEEEVKNEEPKSEVRLKERVNDNPELRNKKENERTKNSYGMPSVKKLSNLLGDYVNRERRDVKGIEVPKDEIAIGLKMLDELTVYVSQGNINTIKAILCGYSYFLAYHNYTSDNVNNMFNLIYEYDGGKV